MWTRLRLTCVTHVVVKRRVREVPTAAGLVAWFGIVAAFEFGRGVGVRAQVSGLHRGLRLQTRIVARLDLRYTSKHVVKPETVTDFVDHCVSVTECTVEGRVQHDSTCENTEKEDTHHVNTATQKPFLNVV